MFRYLSVAALLIGVVYGCSQPVEPLDPTDQALQELRAGNFDAAILAASEAIKASPGNAAAYLYRGRAYHYRNAMGDAHRAIEDLSEAIRLAPDSSDAYYSRALVHRELGQSDLAALDDSKARELDKLAKATFDQVPDLTPPPAAAGSVKAEDIASGEETKKPSYKSASELLREAGDADLDDRIRPSTSTAGPQTGAAPAPVDSEFNKQYREILGRAATSGDAASEGATSREQAVTDLFGRPIDQSISGGGLSQPELGGSPLSTSPGSGRPSTTPWQRSQMPSLQSPFAQRPTTPTTGAPGAPPVMSTPFPQATRGATGYVPPPVSPFGGPAAGRTPSRPFSTPSASRVVPQNSAVRPPYPRDYLP